MRTPEARAKILVCFAGERYFYAFGRNGCSNSGPFCSAGGGGGWSTFSTPSLRGQIVRQFKVSFHVSRLSAFFQSSQALRKLELVSLKLVEKLFVFFWRNSDPS